ncbi:protein NPAT isoform X2 [Alosa alosa]|uniref:protein NPAT isoform X2 n=1 Tax=Alosa alosa TaxID=278164 RepID=UPI0020151A97|nr:protein NPAT isoform X2 [Alosa alosa]
MLVENRVVYSWYLQEEGLSGTSRAFILESPNLKEYAEHSTEDGLIPACVFSLFGKNLKTILNEYVASKTKEISQENHAPAMLSSLWKKLDITLNQIKCLENSPIVYSSQRMRTKNGIIRNRALASPMACPSPSGVMAPSPSSCAPSPLPTPHGAPGHSTPVCVSQARLSPLTLSHPHVQDVSRLSINLSHNTPLQIIVPDQRLTPGPLSPARRKCDSPRRRGGCLASGSGTSRANITSSGLTQEGQGEEVVSENFPQMVIENAREKILKDRSLQEKLAENINKILASDNSPQASKAACSSVDQDQSIDEILGLQGEIHMTDDAIQDILEQTESDPAFQALFDLFDYGKEKTTGAEEVEGGQRDQESQDICHVEEPTETGHLGPVQEDSASCAEPSAVPRARARGAQEAKNKRKSTLSSNAPKNPAPALPSGLPPSQPASESPVSGRGSSADPKQRVGRRHTRPSQHLSQASRSTDIEDTVNMDVDDPVVPETDSVSLAQEQSQVSKGPGAEQPPAIVGSQLLGTARDLLLTASAPVATAGYEGQQESAQGHGASRSAEKAPEVLRGSNNKGPVGEVDQSKKEGPLSQGGQAVQKSQTPDSLRGSGVSVLPPSAPAARPAAVPSSSSAAETDPGQIVSLKIIVSDEQEQPSTDTSLSQAVSSISEERIPTIYLSSPAKSPARGVLLSAPSSGVTPEETVQAVSCLQRTEVTQDGHQPLAPGGAGDGFFQLLPASTGPSSYFVVTDQVLPGDHQSSVVVVPGAPATQSKLTTLPQVLATPPRSRTGPQPYGSTFIISSPVQSMLQSVMLPVSVMSQNNTGKFTIVPNQVLTLPCTTSVTQPATLVAKPNMAPQQDASNLGKTVKSIAAPPEKVTAPPQKVTAPTQKMAAPVPKAAVPLQCQSTEPGKAGGAPGHVRMLCFDAPSSNTPTPPAAPAPAPVGSGSPATQTRSPAPTGSPPTEKQTSREGGRAETPKPIILGGSRSKRRVETVRVEDQTPQPSAFTAPQNRDTSVKIPAASAGKDKSSDAPKAAAAAVQQGPSTRFESRRKPHMTEKPDAGHTSSNVAQNTKPSERLHLQSAKSTGAKRDGKESGKQEMVKAQDGRAVTEERTAAPQGASPVTANKENELEAHRGKERGQPASPAPLDPASAPSAAASKALSKTSPLTKQAAEMLQDIQGLHPAATPPRKQGLGCLDLPLPRTPGLGRLQEDSLDGLRTPGRQRQGREGEGTPRHLLPPATPELPSCSPASETGSENSINMAAHTLMILSRAARTGGPLKDSLRQEEAAAPTVAAKSKKRKPGESSPADQKEHSSSKKKAKKQKKLLDSFPDDLDVDKFLSSLHYDE